MPMPGPGQMLVKVRAAAVNPLDWHFMRGEPYIMRLVGVGVLRPTETRLGADMAGVVEAVGAGVTAFKPGDEVFGAVTGGFAEYVLTNEKQVVRKPLDITFEQAAAAPVAGLTALQALRDTAKLQAGQRVLINGASGGVGTFAVQIAKSYGAIVTGVTSSRNVELVTSIGADVVIDYTKESFTDSTLAYDIIFDNVGNEALSDVRRVMTPTGVYVAVGGPTDDKVIEPLWSLAKALVYSAFVSQEFLPFLASTNAADLKVLADLMAQRKVTPVIDRTYTLDQVPDAIRYVETGRARGKVIISIAPEVADAAPQ
jgi:NADPH:quinone reductase-like Zn-dependent oxidoreductase